MKNFNEYIVDNDKLLKNWEYISTMLNSNVLFCAVVKANAYGTGLKNVVNVLKNKVQCFAVANVYEALQVREMDKSTPILILGKVPLDMISTCASKHINISVDSIRELEDISTLSLKNCIYIHIQINTGLNRFGVNDKDTYDNLVKFIENNDKMNFAGVFSHFATKNNDELFIKEQYDKYIDIVGKENVVKHIANSYATIHKKEYQLDMVRVGFSLYNIPNLVISIKSKVINIKEVKKGQTIGYDRSYKLNENRIIGVVPIGYADGFDRRLSNNFYVYINGKYAKVVGNVCMDVFMVDLTGIDVSLYDSVEILGENVTLSDYARTLATSEYEIMLKFKYDRMEYITI